MNYRRLGRAGLQVSELSFGSWVTFHNQADLGLAIEMLAAAYEAGVNFFDNAEVYAQGKSEEIMGAALRELGWHRGSYLVSTKLFWGLNDGPNQTQPQTQTAFGSTAVAAIEPVPDLVDFLRGNPDPLVGDNDDGERAVFMGRNVDRTARAAVFYGIVQQITDRSFNQPQVRKNKRQIMFTVHLDCNSLFIGLYLKFQ